jgi:hypothetical protein
MKTIISTIPHETEVLCFYTTWIVKDSELSKFEHDMNRLAAKINRDQRNEI